MLSSDELMLRPMLTENAEKQNKADSPGLGVFCEKPVLNENKTNQAIEHIMKLICFNVRTLTLKSPISNSILQIVHWLPPYQYPN
jgi:hypothetical protein